MSQDLAETKCLRQAPVGVFDSGVGGLSVYLHLQQLMPNETFIYYADTLNIPYGNKSGDEILSLTVKAVEYLCQWGCKLIVIACNSASAYALQALRQQYHVPIVGLVPAVKPACALTKSKHIAVLATQATLQGQPLQRVIDETAVPNHISVHQHFEPTLVPWVESGMPIDSHVAVLLQKQTQLWADMGVDVVVLGCTHYPFFKEFLQEYIDTHQLQMTLVDSGLAVAQRVQSLLYSSNTQAVCLTTQEPLQFYASCWDNQLLQTVERLLLGQSVALIQ